MEIKMTTITFQVNLETVGFPTGWEQPSRSTLTGNETTSEASNMKNTRTLWIPGLKLNNYEGIGPTGFLHHGAQFTASGKQAIYLKNTYVSSPAAPSDVLQVVSIS